MNWFWLGHIGYRRGLAEQIAWRNQVLGGGAGAVLCCTHPPTITLGRNAKPDNVLASIGELEAAGVGLERIERGGDVTFHDPGQLMIYPVARISSSLGVLGFLTAVATAISEGCESLGASGCVWQREPAGVWHHGSKVAACGIHISRGVVTHGFALNLSTLEQSWRMIRPCGLDVPIVSVSTLAGRHVTAEQACVAIAPRIAAALSVRPSR